jgi:hypothetical protein
MTAWNATPGSRACTVVSPSADVATDTTMETIQMSANARKVHPMILRVVAISFVLL